MATTVKPKTNVVPPVTGTVDKPAPTTPKSTPSISPPPAKSGFDKFGGKDHYIESQINRWNDAVNSNDTGLMDRLQTDAHRVGYQLPGTNNYKKTDTGLGMGGTGGNGLPSDLSWLGAGANSEIAGQIAAYQGQQQAAQQALRQGIDANNEYLKEQIAAMQQQRAVDQDALQQQQNRFGGLYSGGLNYQGGQINSAYAQQQGNLSRDIAARNNALQQQYGTQASTIAQQIAQLQASQPALINEKIQNYITQYADQYGTNPLTGQQTAAYQGQQFNQGLQNRQFDRGIMESDRNFDRGVLESDRNFGYTQGRDQVADDQWMQEFNYRSQQDGIQNALAWASQNLNERQESRIASNQSGGGSGGSAGSGSYSTQSTVQNVNLPRTVSSMETYILNNLPGGAKTAGPVIDASPDGQITPSQLAWIEAQILDNQNLSEADIVKLYQRFGIPLPGA